MQRRLAPSELSRSWHRVVAGRLHGMSLPLLVLGLVLGGAGTLYVLVGVRWALVALVVWETVCEAKRLPVDGWWVWAVGVLIGAGVPWAWVLNLEYVRLLWSGELSSGVGQHRLRELVGLGWPFGWVGLVLGTGTQVCRQLRSDPNQSALGLAAGPAWVGALVLVGGQFRGYRGWGSLFLCLGGSLDQLLSAIVGYVWWVNDASAADRRGDGGW